MKSKITKRELAAVLRESAVAPNKPGPLKIIIDVGDPRYYMQRTLELVTLCLTSPTVEQQEYYLEQAIFLLGVAKHTIKTNQESVHRATEEHEIRGKHTAVKEAEIVTREELAKLPGEGSTKKEIAKLAGDPY